MDLGKRNDDESFSVAKVCCLRRELWRSTVFLERTIVEDIRWTVLEGGEN